MASRVIHRCLAFDTEDEAKQWVKASKYGVLLYPYGKTKLEHDCACNDNNYKMSSIVVTWNEVVEF